MRFEIFVSRAWLVSTNISDLNLARAWRSKIKRTRRRKNQITIIIVTIIVVYVVIVNVQWYKQTNRQTDRWMAGLLDPPANQSFERKFTTLSILQSVYIKKNERTRETQNLSNNENSSTNTKC